MLSVISQAFFCSICFQTPGYAFPDQPSTSSSHIHRGAPTRQVTYRVTYFRSNERYSVWPELIFSKRLQILILTTRYNQKNHSKCSKITRNPPIDGTRRNVTPLNFEITAGIQCVISGDRASNCGRDVPVHADSVPVDLFMHFYGVFIYIPLHAWRRLWCHIGCGWSWNQSRCWCNICLLSVKPFLRYSPCELCYEQRLTDLWQ